MIAAFRGHAFAASVTVNYEYYIEWQDTSPTDGKIIVTASELDISTSTTLRLWI